MITSLLALAAIAQAPLEGTALLDDLQHRAVDFFWNESNPETGFTKDRAANFKKDDGYTVASSASTGFALAAYPIGVNRKWLNRTSALNRTRLTLKSILATHDGDHGWYYHFVDWKTGKRVWNCELSSIDTSILLAGVWMARQYWEDSQVTRDADAITKKIDWQWMMRDVDGKQPHEFFSMSWSPERGWVHATWAGYCELLMLYIQGYGASDIPTTAWDKIRRNQHTYKGYVFLEGGPLFMHQMSNGFYPFGEMRDRQGYNYWFATQQATLANRANCIENPNGFKGYGPNFWGLSASDTPDGYSAKGAYPSKEDNGTITPTSAIASMPYTPNESLAAAEDMYKKHHDAYGRYGFSNGINPSRNWNGPDVIGIDLGMMLLGVEDYRTGLPWKLSMSHPMVKRGYERAGLRHAFGSNKGPLQAKS